VKIIGHEKAASFFQGALKKGSLTHAYLMTGPPHVGKMTLARFLARLLNCEAAEPPCGECPQCRKIDTGSHPDVQVIGLVQNENTEAKLISIEQVKEIQHSASLPPFEGKCKVFVIDGAELLSVEAANRLLKTLEEPEDKVVFVLLTMNQNLLPETVISRCQHIELRPLPPVVIETVLTAEGVMEKPRAGLLARLSHGCPGWALQAAGDGSLLRQREEEMDRLAAAVEGGREERFEYAVRLAARYPQHRADVHNVLDLWLDYWRDLLLVKAGCPADLLTNIDRIDKIRETAPHYSLAGIKGFIGTTREAGEQLSQNANPRLVLEVMMLDIPERREIAGTTR